MEAMIRTNGSRLAVDVSAGEANMKRAGRGKCLVYTKLRPTKKSNIGCADSLTGAECSIEALIYTLSLRTNGNPGTA